MAANSTIVVGRDGRATFINGTVSGATMAGITLYSAIPNLARATQSFVEVLRSDANVINFARATQEFAEVLRTDLDRAKARSTQVFAEVLRSDMRVDPHRRPGHVIVAAAYQP